MAEGGPAVWPEAAKAERDGVGANGAREREAGAAAALAPQRLPMPYRWCCALSATGVTGKPSPARRRPR
jgi:hypothetical protein